MALVSGGISANVSSIFANAIKGIGDAKMRIGANYIRPGHYMLRMDGIKIDETRNKVAFMAVETTVVKVLDDDQGKGHRVGEAVCHWMKVVDDNFLPNLKAMIAHIMDMKPEEIAQEHAMLICAADQPLTGSVIEVNARQIMTRQNKPFTEVNYKREVPPAEALTVLDAEAQRIYFPNEFLAKAAAKMAEQQKAV